MDNTTITKSTVSYKYKFSIIMAVYNVEPYVAEAIDSLLCQDIGFEKNVQLILIDDGSKDSSGAICDEYSTRYPDNIISLHKENGGVSSARNLGLSYAEGEYLNFMDSDDKLSSNTLSDVLNSFELYKERVDIVSIPFEFFERMTGRNIPHNRKFAKGDRIIDLNKEFDAFQFSLGAAFLRAEACKEMHFDETLVLSEDAKEIYKLFIKKPYLGLCCSACYYYRKRATVGSAVDSSQRNPTCYTYHLKQHYLFMIRNYLGEWGYVPKFVQYAIMYDLQWKVRMPHFPKDVLTEEEIAEFMKEFRNVLSYIENDVILSMKDLSTANKIFTLCKKNPSICKTGEHPNDVNIYIKNSETAKPVNLEWLSNSLAVADRIKYAKDLLEIEGYTTVPRLNADYDFKVFAKVNGRFLKCETTKRVDKYAMDEVYEKCVGFKLSLPTLISVEKYSISFFVDYYGHLVVLNKLSLGDHAPLSTQLKNAFYFSENRILTFRKGEFSLRLAGKKALIKSELALRKEIKTKKFYDYKTILRIRALAYIHRFIFKKPIWLISDRMNQADDNGEAFYLYMKKNKKIRSYFVIGKENKKQCKKLGKVIVIGSFKHLLYSVLADKVISSQIENKTLYDLKHNPNTVKDLYAADRFIFLQHGITINDASPWLNKYAKNIHLFIASTKPEYDSLLYYDYGLTEKDVALTGFPRFDRLYNADERIITIMPTWRSGLAAPYNSTTGEWEYSSEFKSSDFYKFYNELLNSEKLSLELKRHGYRLAFAPHPNLKNALEFFDTSNVLLWQKTKYRDIYAKSSLVVTDYSSAVFDFAYLNKPVIYSQFDVDSFYKSQVYNEGYFNYETMGFGEVEHTLEDTINRIIEYVKSDCQLKPKYKERINSFFEYNDKNNCQRVYDAIINS